MDQRPEPRPDRFWTDLHHLTHALEGEWIPAVLAALAHGPRHFTQIRDSVADTHRGQPDTTRTLHDSILGRTLRRMERHGLLTRHAVENTFPRSTTYRLTPWAADLITALTPAVRTAAHRPPRLSARPGGTPVTQVESAPRMAPRLDGRGPGALPAAV